MYFLSFDKILLYDGVAKFLQGFGGPMGEVGTTFQKVDLGRQRGQLNGSNEVLIARLVQVGQVHIGLADDGRCPSPTGKESLLSKGLPSDHWSEKTELLLPEVDGDGLEQNLRLE